MELYRFHPRPHLFIYRNPPLICKQWIIASGGAWTKSSGSTARRIDARCFAAPQTAPPACCCFSKPLNCATILNKTLISAPIYSLIFAHFTHTSATLTSVNIHTILHEFCVPRPETKSAEFSIFIEGEYFNLRGFSRGEHFPVLNILSDAAARGCVTGIMWPADHVVTTVPCACVAKHLCPEASFVPAQTLGKADNKFSRGTAQINRKLDQINETFIRENSQTRF